MRHFWLAAHILGFVLWMGGGFSAMTVGIAMRSGPRTDLAALIRVQGRLHRALILPGAVMVVLSGLILTLELYGSATSVNGFPKQLMLMQGAGLVAAALVLVVNVPTVARIGRLDHMGEHGPLVAALLKKASLSGAITGILGLTALIAGALLR